MTNTMTDSSTWLAEVANTFEYRAACHRAEIAKREAYDRDHYQDQREADQQFDEAFEGSQRA